MPVNMTELENMDPEELSKLMSMVQVAQMKKKLGTKYDIHHDIEQVLTNCEIPDAYKTPTWSLEHVEADKIIPAILSNDHCLRFPWLMTLACYFPISEIDLRCRLVELFDSNVYHSDMGIVVNNIVPFDVDKVLKSCKSHDLTNAQNALEDFYRKLTPMLNNPMTEGEGRTWIRKCMDDVVFIIHVITGTNIKNRFYAALQFMSMNGVNISGLNDPARHAKIVETFLENGADYMLANRIASCFRIK